MTPNSVLLRNVVPSEVNRFPVEMQPPVTGEVRCSRIADAPHDEGSASTRSASPRNPAPREKA